MQKRIEVKQVEVQEKEAKLHAPAGNYDKLTATGRMLVDSDTFSFIYILEDQDSYVYISLPEETWSILKEIKNDKLPVFLHIDENKLALKDFYSELEYLISNIEGNPNYGEEMVKKVEKIFLPS